MDNENHFTNEEENSSANDYGGNYHYEFDLDQPKQEPPFQQPSGFASAALVLGILSLALCCCCYAGIPLGALGILFALLSRQHTEMEGRAKAGLWLSVAGLCLSVILTASAMVTLLRQGDLRDSLDGYMEYYMGDDYDPHDLDNLFPGVSFDPDLPEEPLTPFHDAL